MIPGQLLCVCGVAHFPALAWKHKSCVANRVVANPVANESKSPRVSAETPARGGTNSRHGKYADPEKRRTYMRDLMRSRRAKAKEVICG